MIVLYILGGLLALILLLLLCDIVIRIDYRDGFKLSVHYAFLRFRLVPSKQPAAKKQKKKAAQKPQQIAQPKKKTKLDVSIGEIVDIVARIFKTLGEIAGKTRVRPCKVAISVASPDAATTALNYGKICAALGGLQALMKENLGYVAPDFRVGWDYTTEKTTVRCKIAVRIRMIRVVKSGMTLIVGLLMGEEAPLKSLTRK